MPMTVTCDIHYFTCLGHLRQSNANRNDIISVIPPKLAMESIIVNAACQCIQWFFSTNFANVKDPLRLTPKKKFYDVGVNVIKLFSFVTDDEA
jgi:hypothetical protein